MPGEPLATGKLGPDLLRTTIYTRLGKEDGRVLVGPKIGEDAAVIDFGDRVLVVHSDPITGAIENIGSLAVKVSTNDVASRGARPRWISVVIFLQEGSTPEQLGSIMEQIDLEAKKLGVAVVGGHTEVTPGLNRPVLSVTAMGEAPRGRYVTSSGAKKGDVVVITKGAAIEGTAIFASELYGKLKEELGEALVEEAKKFFDKVSIAKEASIAVETGGVTAMHDATEGGVAAALQELALASGLGVIAYEEKIPLSPETEAICKALGADPLRTISSGALLISARREKAREMVENIRAQGIGASIIGEFTEKEKGLWIVRRDGSRLNLSETVQEQLWTVLAEHYRGRGA
ncbi:MAG: AIR synthase family protein [Candidatus Brockarchaeota archaeon]|nr:AIR synthase family protein [Candidatus Brockarchaeota archaeon]